jgi:hypothetical protein
MNLQEHIRRILREDKELNPNKRVYDYDKERDTVPERLPFDIDKLVNSGVVFVTPAIDGDPDSKTYKEWLEEPYTHLISLYNVEHSSEDGWIKKAITKVAPTEQYKNFVNKIYDGKYNQILWGLEKLGINPMDMLIDTNLQEQISRFQSMMGVINEIRVPRSERVELYKDDNIIVVVPLTHRALQKYAHQCQWCINDDKGEWEDYHKGLHAVIIQRNPKKPKVGITGNPTASEIFLLAKWDNNQSSFEDVCQMLDYEFRNDRTMSNYYVTISNDINNFATNIVYYSPKTGIYDQEDNFLWNFNIEINDIPNVKPKVIEIMNDYLTKEE